MKPSEQIIREYIQAYNAFDIPQMVSLFVDDCVFESISSSSPAKKAEGIKKLVKNR